MEKFLTSEEAMKALVEGKKLEIVKIEGKSLDCGKGDKLQLHPTLKTVMVTFSDNGPRSGGFHEDLSAIYQFLEKDKVQTKLYVEPHIKKGDIAEIAAVIKVSKVVDGIATCRLKGVSPIVEFMIPAEYLRKVIRPKGQNS